MTVSDCEFFKNNTVSVFYVRSAENFILMDTQVKDNAGDAMYFSNYEEGASVVSGTGMVSGCTFNNNGKLLKFDTFRFRKETGVYFENCDFGDSTFQNKEYAKFSDAVVDMAVGSLFGEGSGLTVFSLFSIMVISVVLTTIMLERKKYEEINEIL